MSCRSAALFLSFIFLAATQVMAADVDADWLAGQQAFQREEFAVALTHFESARSAGLDSPAVHYNVAVCHFKLENFTAASREFLQISERFPRMRGLAEYNLGLAAHRSGNDNLARQYFVNAYRNSSDDEKLRALSSMMLDRIAPTTAASNRWAGAIGARIGNDDNVILRDEIELPEGTISESSMMDAFATVRGPLGKLRGLGFDATAYVIQYFDASEFDQSEFQGKLHYTWQPADWRIQFGIQASTSALGGDSFDRKAGASIRASRPIGRNTLIDLRLTFDEVSAANAVFPGIEGSRQQFDARYRWSQANHNVVARYWAEKNTRNDPGVSPTRGKLGLMYRFQAPKGFGFELGVDIRNSDYDDLAVPRHEDLTTFRVGPTFAVASGWLLSLELRNSENDSSDPNFSYDRSQVTLGIMKTF